MAKRDRSPVSLADWIEARSRYRLDDAHVQMARELGMNPRRLGGKANHRQEPWKAPLPIFIEDLYEKRFGLRSPAKVMSLEQAAKASKAKQAEKKQRKEERRQHRDAAAAREADKLGFSVTATLDREGAVRSVQPGDMALRLSDALIELMSPHIAYPPAESERHLFEAALRFGAEVWNATLIDDEAERALALSETARTQAEVTGRTPVEAMRLVQDIAARKLSRFPDDRRLVVRVAVEVRGRHMLVTATSAHRPLPPSMWPRTEGRRGCPDVVAAWLATP